MPYKCLGPLDVITHLSPLWADHWKIFLVLDEMVWPSLRVMALAFRLVPTWPAGLVKALADAAAFAASFEGCLPFAIGYGAIGQIWKWLGKKVHWLAS